MFSARHYPSSYPVFSYQRELAMLAFAVCLAVTASNPANAQRAGASDFGQSNASEQIPGLVDPFDDDQAGDPSSILDDLPPFDETDSNTPSPVDAPYNSESAFGNQRDPLQAQQTSNRQQPNFDSSGFQANLARAPYMLGDFFGVPGSSSTVLIPLNDIGLADSTPGSQSPTGPFNIVSIADPSGSQFIYRNGPPTPFGEFLVVSQESFNADGIHDFLLSADPSKIPASNFQLNVSPQRIELGDLRTDVSYAAVSNGGVTPSGHDIFDLFEVSQVTIPIAGAVVGRTRLQDNNSAMPQDRVFFDYNFFHNVPLLANGIDVNRFTPGIERTIWGGRSSIEVRVPMAMTLNSNFTTDGNVDTSHFELGNATVSQKFLLASNQNMAVACGMGVTAPTADDFNMGMADGTQLVRVENEAFHVLPYLAVLLTPQHSDFFAHAFATLDFDVNGNTIFANTNGLGLTKAGKYRDQHLLALSASMGKWVYRNNRRCSRVNGVILTSELHFTQTLNNADSVRSGNFVVGDPNANLSLLNGTIGGHVQMGKTTVTTGYTLPLTSDDRVFDGEFRVFVNRKY